jgi:hypothetical protein
VATPVGKDRLLAHWPAGCVESETIVNLILVFALGDVKDTAHVVRSELHGSLGASECGYKRERGEQES